MTIDSGTTIVVAYVLVSMGVQPADEPSDHEHRHQESDGYVRLEPAASEMPWGNSEMPCLFGACSQAQTSDGNHWPQLCGCAFTH
jgi:hypothetical protein